MQCARLRAAAAVHAPRRLRESSSCYAAATVQQQQQNPKQELFPLVDVREQTRELRARVCRELLAGGLIYVSAGDVKHRNGADVYYKFRASSSFVYLTGLNEPGFACLLDSETQHFTLVAPRHDEDADLWTGGVPSLDALAEQVGADSVVYASDLPGFMRQRHAGAQTLHVLEADHPQQQAALLASPLGAHQVLQAQQLGALQALERGGGWSFSAAFLESTLARCRSVKTRAELGCLLEASRGSAAAHRALWAALRPGVAEYQLEAAFVHAAQLRGMQLGYECIVGAGRNAGVLHYMRNASCCGPNDLVLVDAGAEWRCYTADITRTAPASGRFQGAQRDVYALVLELQAAALRAIRPGVDWEDVQACARRLLLERLRELGVVRGSVDAAEAAGVAAVFMPHGLGHHLGLDVHDVSDTGPVPQRLAAGHCVTVEPGMYLVPSLLHKARQDQQQAACINWPAVEALLPLGGVRIEDNVALTCDGLVNFTAEAGLPKAIHAVEEALRRS